MTPATNRPSLSSASGGHAPNAVHTVVPAAHQRAGVQHAGRGRLDPHYPTLVESEFIGSPYCERCGTDELIYLETFVPATRGRDGTISKLGEATYFCSGCEDYSAHAVPASWVPPGWYFG